MKETMTIKVFLLMIVISLISCGSDDLAEAGLAGEWVEVSPVADRTVLVFALEDRLSRIDGEGNQEEYIYSLEGDTITLSLADGQEGSTKLYFNEIEPGRFEIGNLYPSIPESDEVVMLFEKSM